jgi:putative hemolysin
VPENKKCNELLREFQRTNTSIAVVVDEYGGTAGIITIEDLVEELFGEIEESSGKSGSPIRRINKNTWRINAAEAVEFVNEQLAISIPEGEYETIAGFILSELGRIPRIGQKISLPDCTIMVSKTTRTKIIEIRLIKSITEN